MKKPRETSSEILRDQYLLASTTLHMSCRSNIVVGDIFSCHSSSHNSRIPDQTNSEGVLIFVRTFCNYARVTQNIIYYNLLHPSISTEHYVAHGII